MSSAVDLYDGDAFTWKARAVTELPTVAKACMASTWNIWNWKTSWWLAACTRPMRLAATLHSVHARMTFTARIVCTPHMRRKQRYAAAGWASVKKSPSRLNVHTSELLASPSELLASPSKPLNVTQQAS
jgi:hypothetical protein